MAEYASMTKFHYEAAWTTCTVNKQASDLPWFHGTCFKAELAALFRCRFFINFAHYNGSCVKGQVLSVEKHWTLVPSGS